MYVSICIYFVNKPSKYQTICVVQILKSFAANQDIYICLPCKFIDAEYLSLEASKFSIEKKGSSNIYM